MSDIKTFTGKSFDPCDPERDLISIEDIAHALSMICRAGGHYPIFYSVAQHCMCCQMEARERGYGKRLQLLCLLHDASEAYIADITRPVKSRLSDYLKYEKALQDEIYLKFLGSLPDENEQKLISSVDDSMLYHEFLPLMDKALFDYVPEIHIKIDYEFPGFDNIEKEYLSIFKELIGSDDLSE